MQVQIKKQKKVATVRRKRPNLTMSQSIVYVPVDFNNNESLSAKLRAVPGFDTKAKTVVTLEGVSQYIPQASVTKTISEIASIIPAQSTFFVSFAPTPAQTDPTCKRLLNAVKRSGEPWVNFYDDGRKIFDGSDFRVTKEVGLEELEATVFAPKGRMVQNVCKAERYCTAVKS